jgi:hypothetical protein
MSQSQHSSLSRTEKLRSSCDSCHLSKVKCSKTRPLCSRCLVCGTDCTYSPSARVGRKKKGEHTPDYTDAPTPNSRQHDQRLIPTRTSVPSSSSGNKKEEETLFEFDQPLIYVPQTPSTSGYMTPASSDDWDSTFLMDPQSSPDAWIQSPATFEYFPWTTDAVHPSLLSSEVMQSDPNNPWEIWYNTEANSTPYVDPGTLQYATNSSPGNIQHSCQFPANR